MNTATNTTPLPLAKILGVRELPERRERMQKMYDMLHGLSQGCQHAVIIGKGFYVKHVVERQEGQEPNDYYIVYRRGIGTEAVSHIVRVAAMFNPEIFFEGINKSTFPTSL